MQKFVKIIKRYGIHCTGESMELMLCLVLILQDDMIIKLDFKRVINFLKGVSPRVYS